MKKRVLILSTSPRQGGNSDALAASFAEGARSAGHTVSHCAGLCHPHLFLRNVWTDENPSGPDQSSFFWRIRLPGSLSFGRGCRGSSPGCGWCAPRSGGLACLFSQGHPARGCLRLRRHRGWRDTGFSRPVPGPRHGGRSMRWAFFLAALFLCLSGCSGPAAHAELPETFPTMEGSPMPTLCLAVHGAEYPVTLRDSPSTRALVRQLPMTLTLAELNGNEKYARLPEALPTDAIQPGALQTGDLMLYGANCLVLFYQSFPSSYSYTPLGQIEHPDGLASVLGAGSVTVTLSILP